MGKAVWDNSVLDVILLLQKAERNIAAADRLLDCRKFDSVVRKLCRRTIICCKQAYFLYTGEALLQDKAFNDKDVLAILLYARQAFAKEG